MKRILFLTLIMVCALNASAQTYLDHLQTHEVGKGTVTVHQSQEIDKLINGTNPNVIQIKKTATPKPAEKKDVAEKTEVTKKTPEKTEETLDNTVVDTSKKVMRNGIKVTGYRVQVFAGGNSRADKTKAEQISNQIKAYFPGQPVYCHFYSPRWICRMGNFRSYEEAKAVLNKVRELGYSQASIVKGQITVAN